MVAESNRTIYEWIFPVFTVSGRKDFVADIRPLLSPLVNPADHALDICCGAGAFTFLLEDLGATVTGVDVAPYMIKAAQDEAARRKSQAKFIESDVLDLEFERDSYDMAIFLGNTIMDFDYADFESLVLSLHDTLKTGAYFAIHYIDGVTMVGALVKNSEGTVNEGEETITYSFDGYDAGTGAWSVIYHNQERDEEYDAVFYLYTRPMVKAMLKDRFVLHQSHRLSESSFLDIYRKM